MTRKEFQRLQNFVNTAKNLGITNQDLFEIDQLATKQVRAWERCNSADLREDLRNKYEKQEDRFAEELKTFCKSLGIKAEWNGIYPSFVKDGQTYYLPE